MQMHTLATIQLNPNRVSCVTTALK